METITLFHTNDMHSHLEYWPRIAQKLRSKKTELLNRKKSVFVFDSGDAGDRIHPLTEATDGQFISELLNEADYDIVTIGNNEGIGNTKKQLNQLYDKAKYSVVVSNIKEKSTLKQPEWADEIHILTTQKGYKLGVIGCTIPLPTSYDLLGWDIEDPIDAIHRLIRTYKDSVDGFILLSHLGIQTDREIAARFKEIAVIMGGHTHHLLPEGEHVNNTLIAGAGKFGKHVGEISLRMIGSYHYKAQAKVFNAETDFPPLRGEKKRITQLNRKGKHLLQEKKIACLPESLDINWQRCTNFVSFTLKMMVEKTEADLSIINSGLFLKALPKGLVSLNDIHESLPHPMRLLTFHIKGEDLIELIHSMEEQRTRLRHLPTAGFGFRGQLFGEICYSGIQKKNEEFFVKGKPLQSNSWYKVATVDYFLYVPFFPIIEERTYPRMEYPDFIRTLVANELKENYPVPK